MFTRDGYRCVRCRKASRLEAHHIVPIGECDDPYDISNIVSLCRTHHIEEHHPVDPSRQEWRNYLYGRQ